RLVLVLQAADGAGRDDALDAEHLEAVDVGAEVQLRRQDAMPDTVTREKSDAFPAKRADDVGPRRIAEWRRQALFLRVGQLSHVVQAAAADDADRWIGHEVSVVESNGCRRSRGC